MLQGSQAYAKALCRAGVLTAEEAAIVEGLGAVAAEWGAGAFVIKPGDEDIHTANERRLSEIIGAVGGKLHTGRSRNDQVATDTRLWLYGQLGLVRAALQELIAAAADRAEAEVDVLMPGFTHLQPAQTVRWSHWLLSHAAAWQRDDMRLADLMPRVATLPLGSGGSRRWLLDRWWCCSYCCLPPAGVSWSNTTWMHVKCNWTECPRTTSPDHSIAAPFLPACRRAGGQPLWRGPPVPGCRAGHGGRRVPQLHGRRQRPRLRGGDHLLLFHAPRPPLALGRGPHHLQQRAVQVCAVQRRVRDGVEPHAPKKNPDALELIRGKGGKMIGNLTGIMAVIKGTPSTYNKVGRAGGRAGGRGLPIMGWASREPLAVRDCPLK